MQVGFPQKSTFAVLRATKIICNDYDALNATVNFQRNGVPFLHLTGTTIVTDKHLALNTNLELQDISGNALIAGDNSGNIDQLARIDTKIINPTGSLELLISPQSLVGPTQTGTMTEAGGKWETTIDDNLYLYLNAVLHYLMLKGNVYIENITVYINTTHVDAYVTLTSLGWYSAITGAYVSAINDPTDIGMGTTGNANGVLTVNANLLENHYYILQYNAIATAGAVKIYAIKIKYHLT